jgi:aminoglycoside phosphotransferase (APT) family kinase protein
VTLDAQWSSAVDDLAEVEATWLARCAGSTGLHFDLRDDNLLVRPDGSVLVCDWNHLTLGAAWLDLASLLVSVHGDGLDADALWDASPLTRRGDDDALLSFLVALAGFFATVAAGEDVPGSPYLRAHQAWWRDATFSWLERRLGR